APRSSPRAPELSGARGTAQPVTMRTRARAVVFTLGAPTAVQRRSLTKAIPAVSRAYPRYPAIYGLETSQQRIAQLGLIDAAEPEAPGRLHEVLASDGGRARRAGQRGGIARGVVADDDGVALLELVAEGVDERLDLAVVAIAVEGVGLAQR